MDHFLIVGEEGNRFKQCEKLHRQTLIAKEQQHRQESKTGISTQEEAIDVCLFTEKYKIAITAARFEVVFLNLWIAKVPVKGGRHLIFTIKE